MRDVKDPNPTSYLIVNKKLQRSTFLIEKKREKSEKNFTRRLGMTINMIQLKMNTGRNHGTLKLEKRDLFERKNRVFCYYTKMLL